MKMLRVLLFVWVSAGASLGQTAIASPPKEEPLVLLDASAGMLNTLTGQTVEKIEPLRDRILDAEIFGTSLIKGKVRLQLLPDPSAASLAMVFRGRVFSKSVGYNDPVKAYTCSETDFEVCLPFQVGCKGIKIFQAKARARVGVHLVGMTDFRGYNDSGYVQGGEQVFKDDKFAIETVSARHAERRMAPEFYHEVQPKLIELNQKLRNLQNQVEEIGLATQPWHWQTCPSHLSLRVALTRPPASLLVPPPALPGDEDLVLRVHQTALRELFQKPLGGKTINILEFARGGQKFLGTVFSNIKPDSKGDGLEKLKQMFKSLEVEPLAISFADQEPIDIFLEKGGFSVTLHGKSFQEGKTTYPAMKIRAHYKIEPMPRTFTALRQGNVKVFSPTPGAEQDQEKTARNVLENYFNLLMPDRLTLPAEIPLATPTDPNGKLVPTRAETENGWLLLAGVLKAKRI